MNVPRHPHQLPTRKKRQRNRDRISRAIAAGFKRKRRGWARTKPLPNRAGSADTLRRADAKRQRKQLRNLIDVGRGGMDLQHPDQPTYLDALIEQVADLTTRLRQEEMNLDRR